MLFMWFEVIIAADEWAHNTSQSVRKATGLVKKTQLFKIIFGFTDTRKTKVNQWPVIFYFTWWEHTFGWNWISRRHSTMPVEKDFENKFGIADSGKNTWINDRSIGI